jgi:5'-nucleotidase
VYDVFAVAPLGAGIVDATAGSAFVTGYFTGNELKNILGFVLVDNPAHPGEMFPRASGIRCRYDVSRPKFDVVTTIERAILIAAMRRSTSAARTSACTASPARYMSV